MTEALPGGVVLCGGASRRMGRPKAWLPFGPEVLLQRVVRILSSAARPVVVVAAPGQNLPPLPAEVVVARDPVENRGPLQGLAVGLEAIGDETDLVYTTATDAPFLEVAWIRHLVNRIGEADLAMPLVGGYLQPLAALYRKRTVLPAVRELLAEGRLRPADLLEKLKGVIVSEEELRLVDPGLGAVRNLNTPEEYRDALRQAGFAGSPI